MSKIPTEKEAGFVPIDSLFSVESPDTNNKIPPEIEEHKGICCQGCYKLGFQSGQKQTLEKVKEIINKMEDTHCCYTDWRNNGKRIWVKELLSQLEDDEVKDGN